MDKIFEDLKKMNLEESEVIPECVKEAVFRSFEREVQYFDINDPFAAEHAMGAAWAREEEVLFTREELPEHVKQSEANKNRIILIDDSKPRVVPFSKEIKMIRGPPIVVDFPQDDQISTSPSPLKCIADASTKPENKKPNETQKPSTTDVKATPTKVRQPKLEKMTHNEKKLKTEKKDKVLTKATPPPQDQSRAKPTAEELRSPRKTRPNEMKNKSETSTVNDDEASTDSKSDSIGKSSSSPRSKGKNNSQEKPKP